MSEKSTNIVKPEDKTVSIGHRLSAFEEYLLEHADKPRRMSRKVYMGIWNLAEDMWQEKPLRVEILQLWSILAASGPFAASAKFNLSQALQKMGRFSEAKAIVSELIELEGPKQETLFAAANILLSLGDLDEGTKLLEDLINKYPESPGAQWQLSRVLFKTLGANTRSLDLINQAMELSRWEPIVTTKDALTVLCGEGLMDHHPSEELALEVEFLKSKTWSSDE
jgi:tetratricopeptide (TPR) repeat protein